MYKDEVITVRFDKEMLKGFTGYDTENPKEYFKYHPRAKKPPMESLWKKRRKAFLRALCVPKKTANGTNGKPFVPLF